MLYFRKIIGRVERIVSLSGGVELDTFGFCEFDIIVGKIVFRFI